MTASNSSAPSKVLITGAAGFIGSNLVGLAIKKGYQVVALDALTYAGHRENLEEFKGNDDFEFVEGDIRDAELLKSLFSKHSFAGVLNLAAESHVDRSIDGPAVFVDTNVNGTLRLLEASLDHFKSPNAPDGFRFLQVSTDEVFGSLGDTGKFSETTPYDPRSPYSASKASADHLVRAWHHTFELPTIITNCTNNYGPKQFPEKLIPVIIHNALQEKALPVYGEGKNVRDWIHVSDHCSGVLAAFENGSPGGTYCLGGNAEKQNIEVVKTICRHLDELRPRKNGETYDKLISFVTDRAGHDWRYAIDDSLAQKEIGFKRDFEFDSGILGTIQWYLDNQDWCASVIESAKKKG